MNKNTQKYTPNSISILINFGLDDQQFMYSHDDQKCPEQNEYWDPFSKICRQIHCTANFDSFDLNCLDEGNSSIDYKHSNPLPVDSSLALLQFTVYVQVGNQSSKDLTGEIQRQFAGKFVTKLFISKERISDVNVTYLGNLTFTTSEEVRDQIRQAYLGLLYNGHWGMEDIIHLNDTIHIIDQVEAANHVHKLNVELKLKESEDFEAMTIDYIVHQCAEMIGLDSLSFNINEDTQLRIVSLHEETLSNSNQLMDWCR